MAYNIFPKTEQELYDKISDYPSDIRSELISLYSYLKNKFPELEVPINLDSSKKNLANVSRSIQEDIKIGTISKEAKLFKVKIKFGNGSSGNRGIANRGNLFESQFANSLIAWWEGDKVSDLKILESIIDLDKIYKLKECKNIKVESVGGRNVPRPLQYSTNEIVLKNTKGFGFDVGPSITDITIIKEDFQNKKEEIYLSLKSGSTVTFFNVGVRTVLTPQEIKKNKITIKEGLMILDLFGIDPILFCMVFNGKLKKGIIQKNTVDKNKLRKLLKSGIGYGYHVIHKMTGKIISKQMNEDSLNRASMIGNSTVYYGGKTGTGKRIDIEVESSDYKFKLNIRDTQGGDGYPTRLMCDFTYKH